MILNLKEQDGEALKELVTKADIYVKQAMTTTGKVQPALLIQNLDGTAMMLPNTLANDKGKDAFAAAGRLMCVAHGAAAAVFVAEAWMALRKAGEPVDLSTPPSKSPNRQEIVMVMGESRYEADRKVLPILRSPGGRFIGFGEPERLSAHKTEGRFAQFLPDKYPTQEEQRKAKRVLEMVAEEQSRDHSRGFDRGCER